MVTQESNLLPWWSRQNSRWCICFG